MKIMSPKPLTEEQKETLSAVLEDRIRFDKNETILYSHDVAPLPKMMGMLTDSMPDAVALPRDVDDLKFLVDFAAKNRIPLTPRAAATSGVGGSVPSHGGIVVSFMAMDKILDIDKEKKRVTVEPGIVWSHLNDALEPEGLCLKIYPTSGKSSTVGGWIGQGGVGIGSYMYGGIGNCVEEVDVLLANGEIWTMKGQELELVLDCEGVTGIIIKATITVREFDVIVPTTVSFDSLDCLSDGLDAVRETDLPIWNINFKNPDFVELEGKVTGEQHIPDDRYVANIAMYKKDFEERGDELKRLLTQAQGEVHSQEVSDAEWEERFYPMRISRIGPTLLPGEVYLPVGELAPFFETVYKKVKRPRIPMEGTFASPDKTTILAFILEDIRRSSFMFSWGFALYLLDLAKSFGGGTYTVGSFLGREARSYYGPTRLRGIARFKASVDPYNIINPGKIVEPRMYPFPSTMLTGVMMGGKPFLKWMKDWFPYGKSGDEDKVIEQYPSDKVPGLPQDDLLACVQCGYCAASCPVFKETKWESNSPRGKVFALKYLYEQTDKDEKKELVIDPNPEWVKTMYCTLCSTCEVECQVNIPFSERWDEMRAWMTEQGYKQPDSVKMMYDSVYEKKFHNPFNEPVEKRTEWYADKYPPKEKAEIIYFKGCMDSYYEYKTLTNIMKILDKAGADWTTLGTDEMCCGAPLVMSGQVDRYKEIAQFHVNQIKKRGAKVVVTACPGCLRSLRRYEKLTGKKVPFKITHVVELLNQFIKEEKIKFKKDYKKGPVIFHDPCELGRVSELDGDRYFYKETREILDAIPGLKFGLLRWRWSVEGSGLRHCRRYSPPEGRYRSQPGCRDRGFSLPVLQRPVLPVHKGEEQGLKRCWREGQAQCCRYL